MTENSAEPSTSQQEVIDLLESDNDDDDCIIIDDLTKPKVSSPKLNEGSDYMVLVEFCSDSAVSGESDEDDFITDGRRGSDWLNEKLKRELLASLGREPEKWCKDHSSPSPLVFSQSVHLECQRGQQTPSVDSINHVITIDSDSEESGNIISSSPPPTTSCITEMEIVDLISPSVTPPPAKVRRIEVGGNNVPATSFTSSSPVLALASSVASSNTNNVESILDNVEEEDDEIQVVEIVKLVANFPVVGSCSQVEMKMKAQSVEFEDLPVKDTVTDDMQKKVEEFIVARNLEAKARLKLQLTQIVQKAGALETEEVDLTDEENSSFLRWGMESDKLIKVFVSLHSSRQTSSKSSPMDTGRHTQKKFDLKKLGAGTGYEVIDDEITKYLNNAGNEFAPNYEDILNIVTTAVKEHNVSLESEDNQRQMVTDLFKNIMLEIKRRRGEELKDSMQARVGACLKFQADDVTADDSDSASSSTSFFSCLSNLLENDPAEHDPELKRKLEENDKLRRQSVEANAIQELLRKKNLALAGASKDESDDESPHTSDYFSDAEDEYQYT